MKQDLLKQMREGEKLTTGQQIELVLKLSVPAILAQISTIIMEYIDASMVGSLGADASASIGVVATTTWLIGGLAGAVGVGFTVGIAHAIGAGDDKRARRYVKSGFITVLGFAFVLMLIGILIHKRLPVWMGGDASVIKNASDYFLIYALSLPFMMIIHTGSGMLECSGNMKLPGIINIALCFMDVLFNMIFIYPTRAVEILGMKLTVPGFNMGVMGAALGTMSAEAVGTVTILLSVLVFSKKLHLRSGEKGFLGFDKWWDTVKVSLPVMGSSLIMGSAYVVSTKIVSPLGNVAISANSFAITAESLCYMPGYGLAHAATTLVGQAKGAGRRDEEKHLSMLSVYLGMLIMAGTAILLYIFAPQMIGIMTPDQRVRELGTEILRIEALAEPMFGASIVAEGVFRGLGKTKIPSALNLISMWCVRLPLSAIAASYLGLRGVWIIMCGELIFRGLIFLIAEKREFGKTKNAERKI